MIFSKNNLRLIKGELKFYSSLFSDVSLFFEIRRDRDVEIILFFIFMFFRFEIWIDVIFALIIALVFNDVTTLIFFFKFWLLCVFAFDLTRLINETFDFYEICEINWFYDLIWELFVLRFIIKVVNTKQIHKTKINAMKI